MIFFKKYVTSLFQKGEYAVEWFSPKENQVDFAKLHLKLPYAIKI
jgi:hypothetical protein